MNNRLIRQLHLYVGVLFAPTILFFALTGALQLFGLHEESRDGAYTPPALIESLSQVHIHQRFGAKPTRPGPPPGAAARPAARAEAAPRLSEGNNPATSKRPAQHPGAKWFFLFAALGLTASALLGLWMGLSQSRSPRLAWGLLVAGILLPVLLIAI